MSRYILKRMTKEQIRLAKNEAKRRKNRRLDDGEFRRVFAQFRPKEDRNEEDLPIVDLTRAGEPTRAEQILTSSRNMIEAKARKKVNPIRSVDRILPTSEDPRSAPLRNLKEVRAKVNELFADTSFANEPLRPAKSVKKFNRLTKRQFESLMHRAATELGINDKKGLPIMELSKDDYTPEDLIDVVLNNHELGWGMRKEYNSIIRGRRLEFSDKLSILYYLMMKKTTRRPMCLLSKEEKTDVVRRGIVKPRGDIKERPFRLVPDEQYCLEVFKDGRGRTKFDYFDKLDVSKKIEWARYANLILNIAEKDIRGVRFTNKQDADVATFAMKYACKMSKLPEFKNIFTNPYWIVYRAYSFCNHMTNNEYKVFYNMALEYLSISPKQSIPLISVKEAINKLIPTLKSAGLYKKYVKIQAKPGKHNDRMNLETVTNLLLRRIEV